MKINHKQFKEEDLSEMMTWLNTDSHKRTIISITQAKNNDFNIFYWSN